MDFLPYRCWACWLKHILFTTRNSCFTTYQFLLLILGHIAWWPFPRLLSRYSIILVRLLQFIWVRSWRCDCLVTWFCYQMIAKPGNKAGAPSWPDPYEVWIIVLAHFWITVTSLSERVAVKLDDFELFKHVCNQRSCIEFNADDTC